MNNVLFVCRGNIFRSVTAEYALRANLGQHAEVIVASAGTMHAPDARVRDDVAAYLASRGLDVSGHQRRTLSANILNQADLVIAMDTDHQDILRQEFEFESMLFMQACGKGRRRLPDVDDLFPLARSSAPKIGR